MVNRHSTVRGFLVTMLLVVGSFGLALKTAHSFAASAQNGAVGDKILHYVREKFGLPDNLEMTISGLQPANYPAYEGAVITMSDGKQSRNQPVFVTKDHRYLIVGQLFLLGSDPKAEILQHVKEVFKVPDTTSLSLSAFRKSALPNLSAFTVTAVTGDKKSTMDFFVSTDRRCFVLGNVFNLVVDPRAQALRTIVTSNQPSQGGAKAPVTIVEYADLECPQCARLHDFLENTLLPKYGDKVRVVFKEFPLPMHDWSLTAAVANQCVYRSNPEAYARFRSLIFQNQAAINVSNVRDMLLSFADQAGVDRVQLAGCVDAKASLPRVEQDAAEGKRLDVQSTPTCFINGRILVGMTSVDDFYKVVDEALRGGG